jgi:hypothetical protein
MALGVTALEAWRFHRPDSLLFVTPPAISLADAITRDDVHRAYEFIRAGQDPNALVTVHDPTLTGGRSVRVSPLVWAAATGADRSLQMLLGFGARLDGRTARQARCLAEQLEHHGVAREFQRREGNPVAEPCPPSREHRGAPLEAIAEPE